MLEKEIETYLRREINRIGGLCYKMECVGHSGVPDRMILYNSLVIFVELKAPGNKPRPLQLKRQSVMADQGAIIFNISSKEGVDKLVACLPKKSGPKDT